MGGVECCGPDLDLGVTPAAWPSPPGLFLLLSALGSPPFGNLFRISHCGDPWLLHTSSRGWLYLVMGWMELGAHLEMACVSRGHAVHAL